MKPGAALCKFKSPGVNYGIRKRPVPFQRKQNPLPPFFIPMDSTFPIPEALGMFPAHCPQSRPLPLAFRDSLCLVKFFRRFFGFFDINYVICQ